MLKISNKSLERFTVIVTQTSRGSTRVMLVCENCLESFIPFLARGRHAKTLRAYAYDDNNKLAGIYKLVNDGLDLFELYQACDRTEDLNVRFVRAE